MLPGVGNCFRMKISRVQPSNSNSMIRLFWQHITMFFGPLLSLGTFPFLDRTGFPDSPCFFTSTRTGMFVWPRVNSNVQFIPPWRVPAKYLPLDDTKHHPQIKHKLKKIIVLLPGAFANNSHISHNKDVFWVVRLLGDPRRVLWSMDINTFYLNNMNTLIISYGLDSIYGNVHLKPPDRPPWFLVCVNIPLVSPFGGATLRSVRPEVSRSDSLAGLWRKRRGEWRSALRQGFAPLGATGMRMRPQNGAVESLS